MELETLFHTLQGELRAIAHLHKQEAEHTSIMVGIIGKVAYEMANLTKSNTKPIFPENDYSAIATQINTNPHLVKKRKWATESWARYAIRLSKFVGWSVDALALRTAFELQNAN